MRKFISLSTAVTLCTAFTAQPAAAAITLDLFTNTSAPEVVWTTYTTVEMAPSAKLFIWTLDAGTWREVYAGPAVSLAPWCEVSLGAGVERDATAVSSRFGGSTWFGNETVSWYTNLEWGSLSGVWYLSRLTAKTNGFSLGVQAKRFVGEGLYGEWNPQIKEFPLSMYGVFYLADLEKIGTPTLYNRNLEVGFRLSL